MRAMFKLKEVCEQIYKLYPRHLAPIKAKLAIQYALTRLHDGELGDKMSWDESAQFLFAATLSFRKSPAGNRGTMTPYPATWFNRGSYMDDPSEWNTEPIDYKDERNRMEANVGVWRPE